MQKFTSFLGSLVLIAVLLFACYYGYEYWLKDKINQNTPFEVVYEYKDVVADNYKGVVLKTKGTSPEAVVINSTLTEKGENKKVEWIYHSAFKGNKTMTTIDLPSSVTFIGMNAFKDCSNLKTVIIRYEYSAIIIDQTAFDGCSADLTFKVPNEDVKAKIISVLGIETKVEIDASLATA